MFIMLNGRVFISFSNYQKKETRKVFSPFSLSITLHISMPLHSVLSVPQIDSGSMPQSEVLGIAPLQFPPDFKLSPLARSDQSLKIINSYFVSSSNVVSNAATRNNFLKEFPSYKIVQLYTHATGGDGTKEPIIYFSATVMSQPS